MRLLFASQNRPMVWFAMVSLGLWTGFAPMSSVLSAQDELEVSDKDFQVEPFEIPQGSPEELLDFIEELMEVQKGFSSPEELRAYQIQTMVTGVMVADRVLAVKKLDDDEAEKAAKVKVDSLINLAALGAPRGVEQAMAAIRALEKDPRPVVVQFAKNNIQLVRINLIGKLPPKERDELIDEILTELTKRKFAQRVLNRAQMLGESLTQAGDQDRMIQFYTKLATGMRETGNDGLIAQAKVIEGQLRRIQLPGQFMPLSGTTLDGKKLDWKSYRGKVVLIDYWATWCQPCREELPNIKRNYKKYHAKGFEVIGVALDEDVVPLKAFLKDEKIPWVTLFEPEESARGWQSPMVVEYGVGQLPTAILVDREGKVISTAAFGQDLSRMLSKIFEGEEE